MNLRLGIIGAGNMAHLLLDRIPIEYGVSVWNRKNDSSILLKKKFPHIQIVEHVDDFKKNIDVFLLAVNDDAIQTVLNEFQEEANKIFIHHSGTFTIENQSVFSKTGIVWPIYSISKDNIEKYDRIIPIVYHSKDKTTLDIVKQISEWISDKVYQLDEHQRKHAHLIAVLSNNFMNHLLAQCQKIAGHEKIDFELFHPIIMQTVLQMYSFSDLSKVQSGPAIREDNNTIEAHLDLLQKYHELSHIYQSITQSIIRQKNNNE